MFTSDAIILGDVAAMLKTDPSALPPYWTTVVSLMHQKAYDDMVQALIGRGYSLASIAAWARAATVERSHALYLALVDGGGLEGYSDAFIKRFDQTELLTTCLLYDSAGKQLFPERGAAGTVTTGPFDTTTDSIVWPDPNDPHGTPTRW